MLHKHMVIIGLLKHPGETNQIGTKKESYISQKVVMRIASHTAMIV